MMNPEEITPEEALDRMIAEYEQSGDDGLGTFATSEPLTYIAAMEQMYRDDDDYDGLIDFQDQLSTWIRAILENSIAERGFTHWYELTNICRESGDHEAADKIERHMNCLIN